MVILLWLVPPVVVTVLAMLWVSWWGREDRGVVDREEAVARLGRALESTSRRSRRLATRGYAAPVRPPDRSSGLAVRVHARPAPTPYAATPAPAAPAPAETPAEQVVLDPPIEPPARHAS